MRRALLALIVAIVVTPACAPKAQAPVAHAIPFQFVMQRQIVFPMTVDGKPAEAWLDSGASATVLDMAFAKKLGIELGQAITARGGRAPAAARHRSRASRRAEGRRGAMEHLG